MSNAGFKGLPPSLLWRQSFPSGDGNATQVSSKLTPLWKGRRVELGGGGAEWGGGPVATFTGGSYLCQAHGPKWRPSPLHQQNSQHPSLVLLPLPEEGDVRLLPRSLWQLPGCEAGYGRHLSCPTLSPFPLLPFRDNHAFSDC